MTSSLYQDSAISCYQDYGRKCFNIASRRNLTINAFLAIV